MKSRAARGDWEPGSAAPSRCSPSVRLQVQIGMDDLATSRRIRATRCSSEERIYMSGRPDSKIPRTVSAARLSTIGFCGLLSLLLLIPLYTDAARALFGEGLVAQTPVSAASELLPTHGKSAILRCGGQAVHWEDSSFGVRVIVDAAWGAALRHPPSCRRRDGAPARPSSSPRPNGKRRMTRNPLAVPFDWDAI